MTKGTGVGRGRKGIPRQPYSVKNGMKLCRGPTHPEGGEWLPATTKYFYQRKEGALGFQFYTGCKRCRHYRQNKHVKSNTGWVRTREIKPYLLELVNRLGRNETAKRVNIRYHRFQRILIGKQVHVQRRTAARIMLVYQDVIRKNEYRDSPQLRVARKRKQRQITRDEQAILRERHPSIV